MSIILDKLLAKMSEKRMDALIITSEDEFLNKYNISNNRLKYITNFSGSNGLVVINKNGKSGFFTDGRYSLQAKIELEKEFYEVKNLSYPEIIEWMKDNLEENSKIFYDSRCLSQEKIEYLLEESGEIFEYLPEKDNIIDEIWSDKPRIPNQKAFIHQAKYGVTPYLEKISFIRQKMKEKIAEILVLSSAESVCWLFNLRGFDQEFVPLLNCHAIIYAETSEIFVDLDKIPEELKEKYLEVNFIDIKKMSSCLNKLKNKLVWIDGFSSANWFFERLSKSEIIREEDPCLALRLVKNDAEISLIQKAHKIDAKSLIKTLYWVEQNLIDSQISEMDISDKLLEIRSQNQEFFCLSFPSIVGFAGNGAIIHYRPTSLSNKQIEKNGLLLIDSGAQYFSGTTDVTRTIATGSIKAEEKKVYSLVLKSHIMLSRAKFPENSLSSQLDALARYHLWQNNQDFPHGVGHGVGYFLNVHEEPLRIAKNPAKSVKLKPNMILSNEPGFYQEGKYGIRIENLLRILEDKDGFLKFEPLTLVPIDIKCLDLSILDENEKKWLNEYHAKIIEEIVPLIEEDNIVEWLKKICAPI